MTHRDKEKTIMNGELTNVETLMSIKDLMELYEVSEEEMFEEF